MTETSLSQIRALNTKLADAAAGKDIGMPVPGQNLSLPDRLQSIHIATIMNIHKTVQNNHDQIRLALNMAQIVTFHANAVLKNSPRFWGDEVNDDIEQNKFLFIRAQQNIDHLVRVLPEEQTTLELAKTQKNLLDEFDRRNDRRVNGKTLYAPEEAPVLPRSPEEEMKALRKKQYDRAIEDVGNLTERVLLNIFRISVVKNHVLPAFESAGDEKAPSWQEDIAVTKADGKALIVQAETMLTYHAARHSRFERRLAEARPVRRMA